jgi:uncharacterized YccA/Bax inhibitor family protein
VEASGEDDGGRTRAASGADGFAIPFSLECIDVSSHWSVLRFDLGRNSIKQGIPSQKGPAKQNQLFSHYTAIGLRYKMSNHTPPTI